MKRIIRRNKLAFIVLFFFISIGFAYLTRTLGNSGSNFLKSNEWDIHFENIKKLSYSVEATSPAIIDDTGLNISFSTTFNVPGDKYAFYVDVVNDGTIPGMIELVTTSGIPEEYSDVLSMSVLNLDDSEVKKHQLIDAGDSTKLLVIVTYNDDISEDDLIVSDTSLDLSVSIEVIQADNNAVAGPMNLYKTVAFAWKEDGSKDSTVSGEGIFRHTSTKDNSFPVYYYSRNLSKNFEDNVIFGGFCWRIIRTTDTGGVKMIYNGTPVDNKCEAIDRGFDYARFNRTTNALAYHGYMYGESLNGTTGEIDHLVSLFTYLPFSGSLYFGTGVEMVNDEYKLVDPVLLTKDNIDQILSTHKYTLHSSSNPNAKSQYYYIVQGIQDSRLYAYYTQKPSYFNYSDSITYNNGRFSLVSPSMFRYTDWSSNKEELIGKYVTYNDNSIYYINSVSDFNVSGISVGKIHYFGTSYEYENGIYTLTGDVKKITTMSDRSVFNNHKFLCLNSDASCDSLGFIYELADSSIKYIILNNGNDINGTLDRIFANVNNSIVKQFVDNWYSSNLIDYTKYIEDTPYCNDRKIISTNFTTTGPMNINTSFAFNNRISNNTFSFSCEKKDAFTVTETDTGNGALTYPIGLVTADELELSGGIGSDYSPLFTGYEFWTMTPYYRRYNSGRAFNIIQGDGYSSSYTGYYGSSFVKPVISVNSNLIVVNGDGTGSNPYQLFYLD